MGDLAESRLPERLGQVGLVGMVVALGARRLGDFDLPWHLATGRWIVEAGALPERDPFAAAHAPVGYVEWVADVLLYLLHAAGGPFALQVAAALVAGGVAALLLGASRTAGTMAWAFVLVGMTAMNAWLLARPATLSFLFLAALGLLIEQHREAPESARGRAALVAIPPLLGLWANCHGFGVIGLGIVIAWACWRGLARVTAGRAGDWIPVRDGRGAWEACAAAAAGLLAVCANPAGVRYLTGPLAAARDFGHITEWQSPDLRFLMQEPAVVACGLVIVAAVAGGRERNGGRALALWDAGVVCAALAMAGTAVRLIPLAVILAVPVAARRSAPDAEAARSGRWLPVSSLLLPVVFAVRSYVSLGMGWEPSHVPEGAVQWVRANEPSGAMWNFLPFGGYLIWSLYPEHEVLVDGRSGWVHDPELVRAQVASEQDRETWRSLVASNSLEWAVTRVAEGEQFGVPLAYDRAWSMVYFDETSAVYVRAEGENAALAERGYLRLRHLSDLGTILRNNAGGTQFASEWWHDAVLATEQAPESPRAWFIRAAAALGVRDGPAFAEARARLAELAPNHPALAALDAASSAPIAAPAGAPPAPPPGSGAPARP